jgi:hypothetical protein
MKLHVTAALTALAMGVVAGPAAAQQRPSIAVMPAQYFSADEGSADALTQGLRAQFEGQGYSVIPEDRTASALQSAGLSRTMHYADRVALQFGRSAGADLVAYPRLLVLGLPLAGSQPGDLLEPNAVVHLRVLNVRTGAPIYFRQVGHEFRADTPETLAQFRLPEPVAVAAAREVTEMYFQRVAGSREEIRSR